MNDIGKLLNDLVEFIKELRAEIQKQDEILEILKPYIHITNDGVSVEIFFCRITDEEKCNKIEEWLENDK